ncbi:MAG: ABC transporter ATP-binding protein [Bacillota bacterium]|nr:ABC transporter ATP-binding protein [Bacillota bacterium]
MYKSVEREARSLYYAISFFVVIKSLLHVAVAFIIQDLVNISMQGDMSLLVSRIFIILGYLVVTFAVEYTVKWLTTVYVKNINVKVHTRLMKTMMQMEMGSFVNLETGELMSVLDNDAKLLETRYFQAKFSRLFSLCLMLFGLVSMFYLDWMLSLVVLVISMIPVIGGQLIARGMAERQESYRNSYAVYLSHLKNALSGYSLIKLFSMESKIIGENTELLQDSENKKQKYEIKSGLVQSGTNLLGTLVVFGVFFAGAYFVITGQIVLGTLMAFVQLMNYVLQPIESISIQSNHIASCKGIFEKVDSLLETEQSVAGSLRLEQPKEIAVSDVTLELSGNPILNGVSYNFVAGKKYALIGANGSGKSTFLKLLARLYGRYGGTVTINGIDMRDYTMESFYQRIVLLEQECLILHDSIRNNVVLNREYEEAKYRQVIQHCGLSELLEEEARNSEFNPWLMSGGQKQRVGLARALYQMPDVILLDESFSALDAESKMALSALVRDQFDTILEVTHDRSEENLARYDEVILFEEGRIVRLR